MAKNYSRTVSTRKDREKRRKKRQEAKDKGERISLNESRRRAGVESSKLPENQKVKEKVVEPVKEKPTISLNKPEEEKVGFRNTKAFQITQKAAGFLTGTTPAEVLPSGEFAPRKPGTLLTGSVALGINYGAIAGKGADIYTGADAAVNQIISTARSELGGILGKYVLNPIGTATPTISKVGQMTINTKTIGLSTSMLSKAFSMKAMALYGAWASSIFLGRWGQAEAPEAILIPLRDLIENAETPEDWALVEEHLKSATEISDTSIWEEMALWSPFAAIPGIANKARGVAEGVQVLAESAAKVQEIQQREEEQGESDFAKSRRESDEAARERDVTAKEEDKETDLAEMQWKSEYYALIRDGKFEEAEELLSAQG